jgi:hypothetical protein
MNIHSEPVADGVRIELMVLILATEGADLVSQRS